MQSINTPPGSSLKLRALIMHANSALANVADQSKIEHFEVIGQISLSDSHLLVKIPPQPPKGKGLLSVSRQLEWYQTYAPKVLEDMRKSAVKYNVPFSQWLNMTTTQRRNRRKNFRRPIPPKPKMCKAIVKGMCKYHAHYLLEDTINFVRENTQGKPYTCKTCVHFEQFSELKYVDGLVA